MPRPPWPHRVAAIAARRAVAAVPGAPPDWRRVASLLQASRALDEIEETRLVPQRKVLYQFSARGHDLAQILLGGCSSPIRTMRRRCTTARVRSCSRSA